MIKIYTIAVNRPDFIDYQQKTFKRFLAEDHELIVINDGRGPDAVSVLSVANSLGLPSHMVESPRRDTANYAHARSIEWTYEKFISRDDDISLLIDGDIFLGESFSVREWMDGAELGGIPQQREHVRYLWPGLLFLNVPELPNKQSLSFWPDVVDGQRVDVGGHSHEYIRDHPDAKVKWIQRDASDKGCIPTPEQFASAKSYGMEIALSFLHYRCGTNWDHQTADHHREKSKLLFEILDEVIAN